MQARSLDHIVLTVACIEATVRFYRDVLGFEEIKFGKGRRAVRCGSQKINLHEVGKELQPHASRPEPGSADICLIFDGPIDNIVTHLNDCRVDIEEGPVDRTGAVHELVSVYVRDPDCNLVELAVAATSS